MNQLKYSLLLLPTLVIVAACQSVSENVPYSSKQLNEVTVSTTVPDTTWSLQIQQIYANANTEHLVVVSELHQDLEAMGIMAISEVSDTVELELGEACADWAIDSYVIGKGWAWEIPEVDIVYVNTDAEYADLAEAIDGSDKLYDIRELNGEDGKGDDAGEDN